MIGSILGTAFGWVLLGAMLLHLARRDSEAERVIRDAERQAADLRAELRELEAEVARLEYLMEQRLHSTQWDPDAVVFA